MNLRGGSGICFKHSRGFRAGSKESHLSEKLLFLSRGKKYTDTLSTNFSDTHGSLCSEKGSYHRDTKETPFFIGKLLVRW